MIYTVTFNPSLDYVVQVDNLTLGQINRTEREAVFPGGKGNNVSVVLSNLGVASKALGFIAGFTGDALEKMMADYGCQTDFIRLEDGLTRINVKINSDEESEINGQGPRINSEAVGKLMDKLDTLEAEDILVLAGSIPNTLSPDVYEQIMKRLEGREIRIVVDASKELLLNVLKYHPFLIKPHQHELGALFGVELKSDEEIVAHAQKLKDMGAGNVLVSMAGDGAVLLADNGEIYRSDAPKGTVVNSVGAGDSMVAGFLAGYLEKGAYEYALKLGIAAGSATAFVPWLATGEEIEKAGEKRWEL